MLSNIKWYVPFGVEIDKMAARTYQLNFRMAICENASVFDFVNLGTYVRENVEWIYSTGGLHARVSRQCRR